jgi:virulence-associated protein VapD
VNEKEDSGVSAFLLQDLCNLWFNAKLRVIRLYQIESWNDLALVM